MFFSRAACLALAALLSAHGLAALTVSDVAEISNTVNLDISLAGISDNDEAAYRSTNPAAAVFTRDGGDICGQSNFYKTTSSNLPILADCDQSKDRVRRLPFSDQWELPNGFTTLFWHGTCAFGLRNDGANKKVVIRRWDISNVISDSIKLRFVSSGRIVAKGRMICNGKEVVWGVTRSKYN